MQMSSTKNNYKISAELILFLEKEIADYKNNPAEGSTWEEIKNRIKNKQSASLRLRGPKA